MDKSSIEQIFMVFKCTMSRDIPKMGKILRLYILEILGHPKLCLIRMFQLKKKAYNAPRMQFTRYSV